MSQHSKDHMDQGRRRFLAAMGSAGLLVGAGGTAFAMQGDKIYIPSAGGALVVDLKKCMGCCTCMLSCSLAHNGKASLALSRIQITQDLFKPFPDDIQMSTCLQCEDAACVKACPVGANSADGDYGFVRDIDPAKCIGCMQCIEACPHTPKRVQWDPETRTATKCDLCKNTPYAEAEGGPGGQQTCISVCPVNAISFTTEVPGRDPHTYVVNLRTDAWAAGGRTIED